MKRNFFKQNLNKILVILIIIAISLISFIGIYWYKDGRYKNILPEYDLGMNLKGYRTLTAIVDDSTNEIIKDKDGNVVESATDEEITQNGYTKEAVPVNNQDVLNTENYKKTKKIIEDRLKDLKVSGYEVRLDENTGTIVLNLAEDEKTDYIISGILGKGTFELKDEETKEVLIGKENVKKVSLISGTSSTGTTGTYLNIEFNKEGKKKLAEISEKYVSTTAEDGTKTEKKAGVYIDDNSILASTFSQKITNGILQLSIGSSSSDNAKSIISAKITAAEVNNETMPIVYKAEGSNYIQQYISKDTQKLLLGALVIIMVVIMLILVFKYKKGLKGLLAAILYIGNLATLLLVLRIANVEISVEGIFAIIAIQIINYILTKMILDKVQKNGDKRELVDKTIVEFAFKIIPLYVISIVFTLMSYLPIYSFGNVMFWGLSIVLLYNIVFSRIVLTNNGDMEVKKDEK